MSERDGMIDVAAAVEALFTRGGDGARADRLVLWDDGRKRELAGWSRGPIRDRANELVARALEAAAEDEDRRGDACNADAEAIRKDSPRVEKYLHQERDTYRASANRLRALAAKYREGK